MLPHNNSLYPTQRQDALSFSWWSARYQPVHMFFHEIGQIHFTTRKKQLKKNVDRTTFEGSVKTASPTLSPSVKVAIMLGKIKPIFPM